MEIQRTTLQDYLTHLEAWEQSGLSKSEYCRQQGIKYHRFLYWRKKCKQKERPDNFYPLEVMHIKPGEIFATVTLMNRCTVELHQPVSASYIGELAMSCS